MFLFLIKILLQSTFMKYVHTISFTEKIISIACNNLIQFAEIN